MGEIFLKLLFILKKSLLKSNLIINLTSITESNFTLSYSNKNHFLKLIFDIVKLNINYFFKNNFFQNILSKELSQKLNLYP